MIILYVSGVFVYMSASSSVGREVALKPEGERFDSQSHWATCRGVGEVGQDTKTP